MFFPIPALFELTSQAAEAATGLAAEAAETASALASEAAEAVSKLPPGTTVADFTFDYSSRVPASSIVCMVIGLILMLVPAIWLFVHLIRRFRLEPAGVGLGMLAGMISMLFVPVIVGTIAGRSESFNAFMSSNTPAKMIVYSLLNVVPVAACLYFGLKISIKRSTSPFACAVFFALGMGVTPMFAGGLPNLMNYLSAALSINQGQMERLIQQVIDQGTSTKEEIQLGLDSMAEFIGTPAFSFLAEPLGLFLQMLIYIGTCILAAGYFAGKSPKASLYKSLGVYGLYAVSLYVEQAVSSTVLAAVLNFILAAIALSLAYLDLRAYLHDEWNQFTHKPDPDKRDPGEVKEEPKKKMPKIVMPKD